LAATSQYPPDPQDTDFYYPLPRVVPFTSDFGWRVHPIYGDDRFHAGVDLGAPEGMPVLASHSGWVKEASWVAGYGNMVLLEYGDGKYQTRYAHLSKITVKVGEAVAPRQIIGAVGSTGGVTGPHLHFELRRKTASGWTAVNPASPVKAVEAYASIPTPQKTANGDRPAQAEKTQTASLDSSKAVTSPGSGILDFGAPVTEADWVTALPATHVKASDELPKAQSSMAVEQLPEPVVTTDPQALASSIANPPLSFALW